MKGGAASHPDHPYSLTGANKVLSLSRKKKLGMDMILALFISIKSTGKISELMPNMLVI